MRPRCTVRGPNSVLQFLTVSQNRPSEAQLTRCQLRRLAQFNTDFCSGCDAGPATSLNPRGRPRVTAARIGTGPSRAIRSSTNLSSFRRRVTDPPRPRRTAPDKQHSVGSDDAGHIRRLPCYNSIFNVFEDAATFDILRSLIEESASPLKAIETGFACDSSGFAGGRFDRWYNVKWKQFESKRCWIKAHIMCGTVTNIITAVEIHGQSAADTIMLKPLLDSTAARFNVREVYGDLAYSSRNNLRLVVDAGAVPLIPFKKNAVPTKCELWERMHHYFNFNRAEFMERYHRRSNIESTFSMVKAKFGDGVRSKTDVAMKNDVLAKFVAHNICCLIMATCELNINSVFWGEPFPASRDPSFGRPSRRDHDGSDEFSA